MMRKGMIVRYTSWAGLHYSALVRRSHRDGSASIAVYFPLDAAGNERRGCFQGDKLARVRSEQLATLVAQSNDRPGEKV